jgi:hypothetical protein
MKETDDRTRDLFPRADYPLARNGDEVTSHVAAADLRKSLLHAKQKRFVLHLVEDHPGCTARKLSWYCADPAVSHDFIHKRLPDLEKEGLVRKGPICYEGRPAVTWFPVKHS